MKMETTKALISKLVQTKSIERALAPIATQVSQLVIQNEAYDEGETDAFPADPVVTATEVKQSVDQLVNIANRLTAETTDEELKSQMPKASEGLEVSGCELVISARRILVEKFRPESRRHFIRIAKDVLERTLKVLLVTDDAEVRRILHSAEGLRRRMQALTAVDSTKTMVNAFKNFTESLMLLSSLTERRQKDIANPRQQERIMSSMAVMRKCAPMLSAALQMHVKYPHNTQAQASKDYVIGQILDSLDDLMHAIENQSLDGDDDDDEQGSFVSLIDTIARLLTSDDLSHIGALDNDLEASIESAVRHSMAVAHLSVEPHRSLLIKNCHRILKERGSVAEMGKQLRRGLSEMADVESDLREACMILLAECQDLERHVNASLLQLFVDVFKETTEPVDRMVKAAFESNVASATHAEASVQLFTEAFHSHSDRMCHVARLLAASSTDTHKVQAIRNCTALLERLDPEMAPATLTCHRDPKNKAAVEHLRLLKREWGGQVLALVLALDAITDPKMFIHVSEVEMRKDVVECKESLGSDLSQVASATRALIGHGRRVVHVTTAIVDNHHDPLFRNGLMVYVNKLNKAIPSIKSAANKVLRDPSQVSFHDSLHRRCDHVLKVIEEVREGLDGRGLPGILHPARRNARSNMGTLDFNCSDEETDSVAEKNTTPATVKKIELNSPPEIQIEFTDDSLALKTDLKDLGRNFCSAAVAGDKKKVDLIINDILSRCNHATEMARCLASCVLEEKSKDFLLETSAEITQRTPQLIDKSHAVVADDGYQVEPLHKMVDEWVLKMSCLEYRIDEMVVLWKAIADRVMEATQSYNPQEIRSQLSDLEEQKTQISMLVSMALKLINMGDIFCQDQAFALREYASDLENMTSLLTSLADLSFKAGGQVASDQSQLQLTCREWATKAFCVLSLISNLGHKVIHQQLRSSGRSHKVDLTNERVDFMMLDREIGVFTENTIRLKDSASYILQSAKNEKAGKDISQIMDNLDALLSAMVACLQNITDNSSSLPNAENLHIPVRMCLLQWDWARQAKDLEDRLDDLTGEYGRLPLMLLISQSTEQSSSTAEVSETLESFKATYQRCRRVVLNAVDLMPETEQRRRMLLHLKEMDQLHEDVIRAALNVVKDRSDRTLWAWQREERKWASRCHRLATEFGRIIGTQTQSYRDVDRMLSGFFVSREKDPSPPRVNNPTTHARQFSPAKSVLKNFKKTLNGGHEEGPEGSLKDLSGSLMDFADDLLDDSVVHGNASCDPLESFISQHLGSISMTTSQEPPAAAPCSAADVSYKELKSLPAAKHTTPERPSQNSGFRMTPRPLSTSRFGESPIVTKDLDRWEDEDNEIVSVAKEIGQNLHNMIDFTKSGGPIKNKEGLIMSAKTIAKDGEKLHRFASILGRYCVDKRVAEDLRCAADFVPTVTAQLNILASVKAATSDDVTAHKMLIKTGKNLAEAINKMLKCAEACCVKGLKQPPSDAIGDAEAVVLASKWRHRLDRHRAHETLTAATDSLGLRRVSHAQSGPALTQITLSESKVDQ